MPRLYQEDPESPFGEASSVLRLTVATPVDVEAEVDVDVEVRVFAAKALVWTNPDRDTGSSGRVAAATVTVPRTAAEATSVSAAIRTCHAPIGRCSRAGSRIARTRSSTCDGRAIASAQRSGSRARPRT